MFMNRRRALQLAAMSGVLGRASSAVPAIDQTVPSLRILILGGTGFIGPHMVEHALEHGHQVTLFNRGRLNPSPGVELLKGDRDGGLDVLKGRTWDVVVDNSGYLPRLVRDSARLLESAIGHYIFVSSVAVYPFDVAGRGQTVTPIAKAQGFTENGPLQVPEDPESEDVGKYYGQLKVLCEETVQDIYPGRSTILRVSSIVGPGDNTDRFTHWPVRINKGGEMLAPGDPRMPMEYIDVRDLAVFLMLLAETGDNGVYNVAGPEARLSIAEFLYGIRAITAASVRFTWVDEDFLLKHNVNLWRDLPIRMPVPDPAGPGISDNTRSIARGLTYRPLADTARDTLDWFKTLPKDRQVKPRTGLTMEAEANILTAWHRRNT